MDTQAQADADEAREAMDANRRALDRKSIPVSAGLTAAENELLDELAALQRVSHAEIVRRALRLLAGICELETRRAARR